jgi:hypothetical protein
MWSIWVSVVKVVSPRKSRPEILTEGNEKREIVRKDRGIVGW